MKNYLGDVIYKSRLNDNLTQDQYGAKYGVSGPAIFKFEKGHVAPSLGLWLKMSADTGITERRAVLIWVKNKLPAECQEYIELQNSSAAERETQRMKKGGHKADYSKFDSHEQVRAMVHKDKTLPKGLRDLLADDELWTLYRPNGSEINMLRDIFGPLGRGSKVAYREALRLIRDFAHSF